MNGVCIDGGNKVPVEPIKDAGPDQTGSQSQALRSRPRPAFWLSDQIPLRLQTGDLDQMTGQRDENS